MTAWETRGYLTYPNHYGQPKPGSTEELQWSKGWSKAQREAMQQSVSDYHKSLADDALLGRESFFAHYDEF